MTDFDARLRHLEGLRIPAIFKAQRCGNKLHGVLDQAQLAQHAVQLHHQPAKQHIEAQHKTERERNLPDSDRIAGPQINGNGRNRHDHQAGKRRKRNTYTRERTHEWQDGGEIARTHRA